MGSNIKSLAMNVLQRHSAVSIQSQTIKAGEIAVGLPQSAPSAGVELPTRAVGRATGGSTG